MTDFIELGGHRVEVRRHASARHVKLSVDPRFGAIRLTLPKRVALSSALRWARGQINWVNAEAAKRPQPNPILPDMEVPLGDDILIVNWSSDHSRVPKRVGDELWVGGESADLTARVIRWLKREALRQLTMDTQEIAARAQVSVGRVGVGDPGSRWGSCSAKGDIRYSWRLIMAPVDVRRATVAHEVAHRVHMNHSAAFHDLVRQLSDSDVQGARGWLRTHGHTLHHFGRGKA